MSVAAIMMVKDEGDIIEATIGHLLNEVDGIIVADNLSTDGTYEKLLNFAEAWPDRVEVRRDEEVAYYQSDKMTMLAHYAKGHGYDWVVPCDADEIWYSPFGTLSDVLGGLDQRYLFAEATLLNHLATGLDDAHDPNPVTRLGWRLEQMNALPKIACRAMFGLRIGMGNHDAETTSRVSSNHTHVVTGQLYAHHFPWRSEQQFVSKISNGAIAYAATNLDPGFGAHWRGFGLPTDEGFLDRVRAWYWDWGYRQDPGAPHDGGAMVYDPAPV